MVAGIPPQVRAGRPVTYRPGDDVIVTFDGQDHPGVVLSHLRGWVMADIDSDPEGDYGSLTSRMAFRPTVCVKETDVRPCPTG